MIRFPCINYCDFENLHKYWGYLQAIQALLCHLVSWKSRMIVNESSNLVEFYVKMGKMNCNLQRKAHVKESLRNYICNVM